MNTTNKNRSQTCVTIAGAVSTAFQTADELREELQSWYDNLPEAFQSGSKGDALQEAISGLEEVSEPAPPDIFESIDVIYTTQAKRRPSRADRRDEAVNILDNVISEIELVLETLGNAQYVDEVLHVDGKAVEEGQQDPSYLPIDESDRDTLVDEIETFRDDVENAKAAWENVEFPGMYS